MNKAIGVLVIGLGLIMIVIGITGTQRQVLADLKAVNPNLRSQLGGGTAGGSTPAQNAANATTVPGLAPTR